MGNVFFSLQISPEDRLEGKLIDQLGLTKVLNTLYDRLADDQAVEILVYNDCIVIGHRRKNEDDVYTHKFTNFGFNPLKASSKSDALIYAIHSIEEGSLPQDCYDAINGDINALRQTTRHIIKIYKKKIQRLKISHASSNLVNRYEEEVRVLDERLRLSDEEFAAATKCIVIEIPKNPNVFYPKKEDDHKVHISGDEE